MKIDERIESFNGPSTYFEVNRPKLMKSIISVMYRATLEPGCTVNSFIVGYPRFQEGRFRIPEDDRRWMNDKCNDMQEKLEALLTVNCKTNPVVFFPCLCFILRDLENWNSLHPFLPKLSSGGGEVTGTVHEPSVVILATPNKMYPTNQYCFDERNIEVVGGHPASTWEPGAHFELHEKREVRNTSSSSRNTRERVIFFRAQDPHRWGERRYITRSSKDRGGADGRK